MPKKNFKLTIQYLGTAYNGWQYQPNQQTIQGELESALKKILHIPASPYLPEKLKISLMKYLESLIERTRLNHQKKLLALVKQGEFQFELGREG